MRDSHRLRRFRGLTPLLALAALGVGCMLPGSPPTYGLAKSLRMPHGDAPPAPRLSANVSAVVFSDEGNALFPWVEGALSVPVAEHYDLAISAHAGKLNVDGNLSFALGDRLRLGLLHGAGVGLVVGDDPVVVVDASVGALLQLRTGESSAAFLAGRWVYSDALEEDTRAATYLGGALGLATRIGERLTLTPELLVASAGNEKGSTIVIVPSLGLSADF